MSRSIPRGIGALVLAVVFALGVLTTLAWQRNVERSSAAVVEPPAPLPDAPYDDDVQARNPSLARATPAPARMVSSGVDQDGIAADPAMVARKQEEIRQSALQFDRQHAGEPLDPGWASVSERALLAVSDEVQAQGLSVQPGSVEMTCRSRSCRVLALFDSLGEAQDWANVYATAAGQSFTHSQVIVIPEGGRFAVRIFAARN
jgi:hypothetical protein